MHTQALILATWLGAALALVGFGALIERACGRRVDGADDLLRGFWLGWCGLLLSLQLWHLVLPVDGRAVVTFAVLGAAGLLGAGRRPWRRLLRAAPRNWVAVLAAAGGGVWLSNGALQGPRFGDSGAYFIPIVRWVMEYPVVPGLGNLHAHLASNQSSFRYVALLQSAPLGHGYDIANGLLVAALWAQASLALGRLLRLRRAVLPADALYVLLLPAVLHQALGFFLTSPSPDLAVAALQIVAAGELLQVATGTRRRGAHLAAVTLLAVTGITVKLSFAGTAVALLPVAFFLWWRLERPAAGVLLRAVTAAAGLGVVAIGPWVAGNVIMTGCPLYPSLAFGLPVEWRVRTDFAAWVRDIAPVVPWATVFGNPRWYLSSLAMRGWSQAEVVGPLAVAAGALVVGVVRRCAGGRAAAPVRIPLVVVAVPVVSLIYCLRMAPTPRFAGAAPWVLAALAVLAAAGAAVCRGRSPVRGLVLVAVMAASVGLFHRAGRPPWIAATGFPGFPAPRAEPLALETGLVVQHAPQCWEAPLPCTPYPNPALRLRRDGDLGAGFMLDPEVDARHRYDPRRARH